MSGITDLAKHIKDRDNPSPYTPMFGKIISFKSDNTGQYKCLGLTDELLRVFVINDRAGVYDHRWDGTSE